MLICACKLVFTFKFTFQLFKDILRNYYLTKNYDFTVLSGLFQKKQHTLIVGGLQ